MENEYMWKTAHDMAMEKFTLEHSHYEWDNLDKYEKEDLFFFEYNFLKNFTVTDSDGNKCNCGDFIRFTLTEDEEKHEYKGRIFYWKDNFTIDSEPVLGFETLQENGDIEDVYWKEDMQEFHLIKQEK